MAQQIEAVFQRRAALALIFLLRDDPQRLTEVFLMQTFVIRLPARQLDKFAVVPLDQDVIDSFDASCFRRRRGKAGGSRKPEAQKLVEDEPRELLVRGLQDMRRGAPPSGTDIVSPETFTATLSCAPARDSRTSFSPASSGRRGSVFSMSASSSAERFW